MKTISRTQVKELKETINENKERINENTIVTKVSLFRNTDP